MFIVFHADRFEVASLRARGRWADAIDELRAEGELVEEWASLLQATKRELSDTGIEMSRDELHRLMHKVRRYREVTSRSDAEAKLQRDAGR